MSGFCCSRRCPWPIVVSLRSPASLVSLRQKNGVLYIWRRKLGHNGSDPSSFNFCHVLRLFCKTVEGDFRFCAASKDRNYGVVDYVTGKHMGAVSGHSAHLPVEFDGHLLLEVRPSNHSMRKRETEYIAARRHRHILHAIYGVGHRRAAHQLARIEVP